MSTPNSAAQIPESTIAEVARALWQSRHLLVLSGAGISKESGIPTFRDAQEGLWARFDPMELATPQAFRSHPKRVWDWYEYRRALIANARPNAGHRAIAELEALVDEVVVITQNIDGLHQEAGSHDVIPIHGDIRKNKCSANCRGNPTYVDVSALEWDTDAGPPRCPHCGAYVRPDVVWFGENLPSALLDRAERLCRTADVMLVVGTSGVVQPVASFPFIAARSGAVIVEVNPDTTPITPIARWHLAGPSGELLPRVVAAMRALRAGDTAGADDA